MVGTFFNLLALAAAANLKLVAAAPAPELVTVTVPPFFDPQSTALQAAVVGVDSQGHTTYALKQDEVEGSSTLAFITGTLVAGGDPAVADYTLSFTSQGITALAGFDCGLQSGGIACPGLNDGDSSTAVTQLVLDVTGTGAPANATPASGNATPANGGSSQATGNAPAQPTRSKPSSAQTLSAWAFMLISPLLAYYLL
ncbi:hypothetical protein FB45DRAFT_1148581 [Roridomyces roridus]|uniref:Uncharacterized protein n=1 Tax=Roridomyces roridus TaxID=1738132 RepID=A0AAD7BXH8_9AGAR|nr:hypothetical protein FB45DRAFT_1148581 [Roridomyces roridus]